MSLVLGVDGGNSKAIALVARPDGTIVGAARRLGSADLYAAGPARALEVTRAAVAEALASAGAARGAVSSAVFSMAGADWPEDFELLAAELGDDGFAGPITVVNDAIGALAGAVPDGPAVVVSIGTGAATGARGPDGTTWHSSFWQSPQGAGELARASLGAVRRAELGIGPPTLLRDGLLAATDATTVEDALRTFTSRQGPGARIIGRAVQALFAAADGGDDTAVAIVERHGSGLGEVAAAAARRVGADAGRYALGFTGGLVRPGTERLVDAAMAAVTATGQRFERAEPRWQPAVGAVVIGLRSVVPQEAWPAVAERLDATSPASELFEVLSEA